MTKKFIPKAKNLTDSMGALWYSRGYLPHMNKSGLFQFVTFRLCDSVPALLIQQWKHELEHNRTLNAEDRVEILTARIQRFVDGGNGECILQQPEVAHTVEKAFHYFDKTRYNLIRWCIMPNHVHVLIEVISDYDVGEIVKSWKSHTTKEIKKLLNRTDPVWMRDYYDTYIRDAKHLEYVIQYIDNNPVKARLVEIPQQWPYSSAYHEEKNKNR